MGDVASHARMHFWSIQLRPFGIHQKVSGQ